MLFDLGKSIPIVAALAILARKTEKSDRDIQIACVVRQRE
jgi:hypothetical protein